MEFMVLGEVQSVRLKLDKVRTLHGNLLLKNTRLLTDIVKGVRIGQYGTRTSTTIRFYQSENLEHLSTYRTPLYTCCKLKSLHF